MNTSEIRTLALAPPVFIYSIANAFRLQATCTTLAFGEYFKNRRLLKFWDFWGLAHFAASKYGRAIFWQFWREGPSSPRVLDLGIPEVCYLTGGRRRGRHRSRKPASAPSDSSRSTRDRAAWRSRSSSERLGQPLFWWQILRLRWR